jgi:ketosteroid isomerase-like protein
MRILASIIILLLAGDLRSEFNSLVEAERAFAQLSLARGTRDAFLANLNDDSIIFRPQAVPGRLWMEKNPPSASQLSWQPAFADIAKSADLGYTTGPWEIRRTPQDAPSAFGHYVTVWRKQADGAWKIAIDIGIGHEAPPKPASVESPRIRSDVEKRHPENEIQIARGALLDAERAFSANTETYSNVLASDARLYRNSSFPFVGQAAIRRALAENKGTFVWKVINADVSGSVDLGYAYGTAEFKPADTSKAAERANYLRIWKRQPGGDWKVVLDLVS